MALQTVLIAALALALAAPAEPAPSDRAYQLVGIGLVVGLNGTGDTLEKSPLTAQLERSLFLKLGLPDIDPADDTRNIAAVTVVAKISRSNAPDDTIDLNVAAMGDATSLEGGTLLVAPLSGADGQVYAIGQGPVIQDCAFVTSSSANGCVPHGAIVQKRVVSSSGG